ncbi:MAG: phosphodiester glycosidase family protein [Clostridia bacterium]|nr:phosphodiester glycosidase family protein [Clostridia bacterium]
MKLKRVLALLLLLATLAGGAYAEEEEAVVPAFGDFSEKYADLFLPEGSEPVQGDLYYYSEDIYIEITPIRQNKTDIYVADIYVRSTENFQRAFGKDKWSSYTQKVLDISKNNDAVIGMTGDNGHNLDVGWVIGNGKVWRKSTNRKRDLCFVYRDGTMETVEAQDVDNVLIKEKAANNEIWHCFLFGPALLDAEGKAKTKFNSNVGPANPRSVIGYYEPGHYCFVQIDGRGAKSKLESGKKSTGLKLSELSLFMEELGCVAAYNLDGGQSSMMYFNGALLSTPYNNGRKAGDIVIIREVEKPQETPAE